MIRLFVTGDVHIGKRYDRYPHIKDLLTESRFDCLRRCVERAEEEQCDFFVVTGDLFDQVGAIRVQDVKKVVGILAGFAGRVLVLPGNHDYYTGEEKVWKDFVKAMEEVDHNILLMTKMHPCVFEARGESVTFYPALCESKHSERNNLEWIRETEIDDSDYHVGIAHGALDWLTPDLRHEYYPMTERELYDLPMDVWLLGHTHIPWPESLPEGPGAEDAEGYTIFNPGTPEQTDLSNRTEGCCFVVTLERKKGADGAAGPRSRVRVLAHRFTSGVIRYFDLTAQVDEHNLAAAVEAAVQALPGRSVVRLRLKGSICEEEYRERHHIWNPILARFLSCEVDDSLLSERISPEKIRAEFAEIGFAGELLRSLEDPKEVQMAYELIRRHRG